MSENAPRELVDSSTDQTRPAYRFGGRRMPRRLIRRIGVRPWMLPRVLRLILRRLGVSRLVLAEVCGRMRELEDWAPAWEEFANTQDRAADLELSTIYYCAQLPFLPAEPEAQRLRILSSQAYMKRSDVGPAEIVRIEHGGYVAEALVQMPVGVERPPLAVIVPGLPESKERNHAFARRLLDAGCAVMRFELLDASLARSIEPREGKHVLPKAVRTVLERYPVDPDRVHAFGLCFGGFLVLHAAALFPFTSATTISAPCDVRAYTNNLPFWALDALTSRAVRESLDDEALDRLLAEEAIDNVAERVTCDLYLNHGSMDRLVPVREVLRVEPLFAGDVQLSLYPFQGHGCSRRYRAITREFVERATAGPSTGESFALERVVNDLAA